jgi:NitT/TauT family transport system ATP-binding protein
MTTAGVAPALPRGGQIEIEHVSKTYQAGSGTVEALRDATLSVRTGEFVSLLGPSGCGKSTLLMIAVGLVPPTSGRVLLDGRLVGGPQTDVGIVFQDPVLLDWRRVVDNVMLQVEARKLPQDEYRNRALELLRRIGLGGFERAYPFELSGGMRQRVSICRALIHDPPLLVMDEPFGALDALSRDQAMIDLQQIWSANRKTVLFVTHHVPEAVFLSDHVVMMTPRPGRIDRVLRIDLPRPRRLKMRAAPAFAAYVEEILGVLQSWGVLVEEPEDGVPGQGRWPSPLRRE